MDRLEKFFENIESIAISLEKISASNSCTAEENRAKNETSQQVENTIPVQPTNTAPMPQQPIATVVPTVAQAESFTQDQIAVAMSNAIAGRKKRYCG